MFVLMYFILISTSTLAWHQTLKMHIKANLYFCVYTVAKGIGCVSSVWLGNYTTKMLVGGEVGVVADQY